MLSILKKKDKTKSNTILHTRESDFGIIRYEDKRVFYDAWGQPCIKESIFWALLNKNGTTKSLSDVIWIHKSGPEIKWPEPHKGF